jgi:hypothetical protein
VLGLLFRLWQQSDNGPSRWLNAEISLLLLEMPIAKVLKDLPLLKKAWLAVATRIFT